MGSSFVVNGRKYTRQRFLQILILNANKMKTITEREQWFLDRVGKRVWRNRLLPEKKSSEHDIGGVWLGSDAFAKVFCKMEYEYKQQGMVLQFFDTPEERDAFELTLKTK